MLEARRIALDWGLQGDEPTVARLIGELDVRLVMKVEQLKLYNMINIAVIQSPRGLGLDK